MDRSTLGLSPSNIGRGRSGQGWCNPCGGGGARHDGGEGGVVGGPRVVPLARAVAPGKVMLLGEYGVLEGGPALVAAVDRYAVATLWGSCLVGDDGGPLLGQEGLRPARLCPLFDRSPGAAGWEAIRLLRGGGANGAGLELDAGRWGHILTVDSAQLSDLGCWSGVRPGALRDGAGVRIGPPSGPKLGLGSSAASCVAAAGVALIAYGLPLDTNQGHKWVGRAARQAHLRHQGGLGSGADIAASVMGGLCLFISPTKLVSLGSELPAGLQWVVVHTGCNDLSTEKALCHWNGLARTIRRDKGRVLAGLAEAGIDALCAGDGEGFLAAVRDYYRLMESLSAYLGLPVVREEHRRLARLAEVGGGASKPCGAGGGLALMFARNEERMFDLVERLAGEGFCALPLSLAQTGVRRATGNVNPG